MSKVYLNSRVRWFEIHEQILSIGVTALLINVGVKLQASFPDIGHKLKAHVYVPGRNVY